MLPCRLFVDPPADGAWNMAVDEALLDDAADSGLATLRFYQWREPTLSLGYFQRYAERESHAASRNAAIVRRLSGGGALLHDRELTYSLCLPASHSMSRQSAQLYGIVHSTVIEAFTVKSVPARLYNDVAIRGTPSERRRRISLLRPPQSRRRRAASAGDSVNKGDSAIKIVGSAQRRRRGAVLQHGAVLLDASPCAPELAGLAQLGTRISVDDLLAALARNHCESA